MGEDFFGGRVERFERLPGGRLDPLAIDEQVMLLRDELRRLPLARSRFEDCHAVPLSLVDAIPF